jgi:hypothetical protein
VQEVKHGQRSELIDLRGWQDDMTREMSYDA